MTQKKGSSHARSFFLLGQENVYIYIYIYAEICNNKHKYLYLLPHHCVTIFLPPSLPHSVSTLLPPRWCNSHVLKLVY